MFTICITANDDNTYKVYVEQANEADEGLDAEVGAAPAMGKPPMPQPMPTAPMGAPAPMAEDPAEDPAEEASEPGAQTVKSIKDALTLALEALKNDGQMSDVNGQDKEFSAGFEGGAA